MFEFLLVLFSSTVGICLGILAHSFFLSREIVSTPSRQHRKKTIPIENVHSIRDRKVPVFEHNNVIDLRHEKEKRQEDREVAIRRATGWSLLWSNENQCFVSVPTDIADLIQYVKKNPNCLNDLKE